MPGINGEVEEHPARRSAGGCQYLFLVVHGTDIHSNIIAIAISSMRT